MDTGNECTTNDFQQSGREFLEEQYELECEWGIPYTSFDSYMYHSLDGIGEILDILEIDSIDGCPFSWGDDVVGLASEVLQTLRNKEILTEMEFSQLCWLEKSLMESVQLGIILLDTNDESATQCLQNGYAGLVSNHQIELLLAHVNLITGLDSSTESMIEPSDELIARTQARILESVQQFDQWFDSSEVENELQAKRDRITRYLKSII